MGENKETKPNGVLCDRCKSGWATKASYAIDGYEYSCDDCLTPAEIVAFGETEANANG